MRIKRASKDLVIRWNETRASWRDDVARGFEEKNLAPLMTKLRTADAALSHMVRVLGWVRRDCG